MKRTTILLLFLSSFSFLSAQEQPDRRNITLKWAPSGLLLGNIGLQGEYNYGKNSLTAKIGVPFRATRTLMYDDKETEFSMKAISFLAGYRMYLSKKHLSGFYLEPYFKYVHHSSEGTGFADLDNRSVRMNFTNEYNGGGIGAQLGVQFLVWKRGVIDFFFLGPEINSASNKFRGAEQLSATPWTTSEAKDAEHDIREFIDKLPFIRNNTTLVVDKENKRVSADFKGALPGYRFGVSFGITL